MTLELPRKFSNRKISVVFDDQDRVWSLDRKISTGSRPDRKISTSSRISASRKISTVSRKSSSISSKSGQSDGIINISFVPDESMQEVHVGYSRDIRRKSVSYLKKEMEIDYHAVDIATLCNRFSTSPYRGLDSSQVKLNKERYGANALTPPKKEPLWLKFLKTLVGGFQLLLWTAAILSFVAYIAEIIKSEDPPVDNLYLGIALTALVVVLGLFTFYQEYSSGKVMESFAKLVPASASVTRDGKIQTINTNELVVGDIVDVKFGDSIPADIRILECQGFKVDNSSLTGESEPQSRSSLCTDENPMETKNLAFFSTNALEGTARGIVVAVGDGTFIGRIAGLTTEMDAIDTPMSREVSHFVKVICGVAVFFGVTFFAISLGMGYTLINAAIFLVGIIVANVPEGLLVTFTVILALTAKRMAQKNCVVRQLHAVETLGSCSVICSDKTGTLTQNKMTVSHMWYGNKIVDATKNPQTFKINEPGFPQFARVAALCSRAKFLADQESIPISQRKINGDASESAILICMEKLLKNVQEYQHQRRKIFEIPFNSSNKWQLSIHDSGEFNDNRYVLVMKGAPERLINLCKKIRVGNNVYDLDDFWKRTFNDVYEQLGGLGERVIGFSELILSEEKYPKGFQFNADDISFLQEGLTFVGLISMIDPPRVGVPEAVQMCRTAGIKVVMVTGDHPITARAIARKVGIISEANVTRDEKARILNVGIEHIDPSSCLAAVINGTELLDMTSEELDDVLQNHTEIVFARVSPQQKLIIVEGFQRLGKIVAVTGDGVNDSPALKKADIGIAMGISGSDVSKQAADMILLDDNFSSIVTGVEEGRLIFENLKKCIRYLLCANTANLLPFICYIIFQIPLPLGTIQMLAITLGTDILPTISLSYEKPEGDIMKRQPRNPVTEKLVTQQLISYAYGVLGVVEAFAGFFTFLVIMAQNGFLPEKLVGIREAWDTKGLNDLEDSYGQEWTFSQRKDLERTCWTAYFCTIVICQWGNLLISKVRWDPIHTKIFDNWIIYFAIFGETLLACILTYTPGLNHAISYMPIKFMWWLLGIPFFLLVILCDEIRRLILRNCPDYLWYQNEFYY